MLNAIRHSLFAIRHSLIARLLIGWIFAHISFALPVKRLRETETLIAFHHPKPSYPEHILLVPKKAIGNISDLTPADNAFLADVFRTVPELAAELGLNTSGYRLIVNAGAYQDVPQLHFHLVAGG